MSPPVRRLSSLVRAVKHWPVASQQRSRRNAMVALTVCAARRAAREDTEAYLAGLAAERAAPDAGSAPKPPLAAHA